ncbi:hypothetical protein K432DRAFT_423240 [Lepidopterella palustris CBS 459.81]|uniref:Uncharacterized protein n=1 Tax=Lepidopterella palustris CBS 459.81 TaxID=1314670 RepID=A0A8E2JIA4_9PEZI|nr:hypothetical protein K432DRAFT_423240 [Lepidopterella palustris CBS 459.81]
MPVYRESNHTLHWSSIASHFYYIRNNPHVTPHKTNIFPRNLPGQEKALQHFARVFATTIRSFSETERSKYPAVIDIPTDGKIFPDELLTAEFHREACAYFTRDRTTDAGMPGTPASTSASASASASSSTTTPKTKTKSKPSSGTLTHPYSLTPLLPSSQHLSHWINLAHHSSNPTYTTSYGSLADICKIFFQTNSLPTLLLLAQHPLVPLHTLNSLSWGHSFGISWTAEAALTGYLF